MLYNGRLKGGHVDGSTDTIWQIYLKISQNISKVPTWMGPVIQFDKYISSNIPNGNFPFWCTALAFATVLQDISQSVRQVSKMAGLPLWIFYQQIPTVAVTLKLIEFIFQVWTSFMAKKHSDWHWLAGISQYTVGHIWQCNGRVQSILSMTWPPIM